MYLLDLNFYHYEDPKPPVEGCKIKTSIPKDYFAFESEPIEVNFRYDTYSIPLVTNTVNQDTLTRITVGLQRESDKEASNSARLDQPSDQTTPSATDAPLLWAPDISLLMKFTYPRFRIYLGFAILLVSQLMIVLAGKFSNTLQSFGLSSSMSAETVTRLDAMFTLLGPLLTSLTLFWLYRRLPGGSK